MSQQKQLNEILDEQISASIHEYKRSNLRLFISAISAGLEVGFSFLLITVLYTLLIGEISQASLTAILAAAYPVGFIFVVIGRSELFTEHTALAVFPVLDKKLRLKKLFQLWAIILSGNLLGGTFFSLVMLLLAHNYEAVSVESVVAVGEHAAHGTVPYIGFSAILAGWLMGLLTWLTTSAQETISRIFIVFLITFFIGIVGLHHSIVGSIEVLSACMLSDNLSFTDYLKFEATAIIGNLLGGTVFVALLKFGQRRKQ